MATYHGNGTRPLAKHLKDAATRCCGSAVRSNSDHEYVIFVEKRPCKAGILLRYFSKIDVDRSRPLALG